MNSPMVKVSELVSSSIGDTLTNIKTWKNVMYNVLENGLVGDGVTDDTAALQTLINTAVAAGRVTIFFPHTPTGGVYYVTSLTNADKVIFIGDNCSFTGGYTGIISNFLTDESVYNVPTNAYRFPVINGGFKINQRGKSGTVTLTAGQYGHDRWKAGSSGCTYTFSTSNNVTTITITSGSLQQVIEGDNIYSGNYILSWTGTSQGRINGGSYGVSGVTALLTGGNNTIIEFNAGTISNVQFNYGSLALPFQPRSSAEELALCQRYYEKSYDINTAPGTTNVNGFENVLASTSFLLSKQDVKFRIRKRAVPTIVIYSTQTGAISQVAEFNISGIFVADRSSGVDGQSETGFQTASSSGNYTIGNFERFHWTADAEL